MNDSITIGFSHPKAWFVPFAWLICLCTKSKFSHAYIQYYNPYANRQEIFQASGLLCNFVGLTIFNGKENVEAQFQIPITTATKLATVQFAIDNVGLPYGMGQVFGYAYVLFMRLFGKKVKNPWATDSSFFCSELVATILQEIIQPGDSIDPSTMSPQDIYNFLISKGYTNLL